jgi:hypothetical protein
MFTRWNALVVALLPVIVIAPVGAQERDTFKDDSASGQEAGGCTATGTGQAYFKTCTTSFGTLSEIRSPFGASDPLRIDGYALCSALGTHGVETGSGEGFGFGTPTTSTPTTNVRKTNDGYLQVTQTFLRDAVQKEIVITVTIRNISAISLLNVRFSRFFDADFDEPNDYGGATLRSAFIWDKYPPAEPGRGLELAARTYTFATDGHLVTYANFVPLTTGCTSGLPGAQGALDDWTGRVTYVIGTIPPGASKIVKFVYRMM